MPPRDEASGPIRRVQEMTRPTRYLLRMGLFVVAVLAVVAALYTPIERAFLTNPPLNGLILGVLLIGIVYCFRQVVMLGRELTWMEAFRRRRPGISLQARPRLLATIATAFGEREGPVRLTAISTRALLDGVSARLDESRQISRYFTGLLILLGLLGTFWGLLETISAVSDAISGLRPGATGLPQSNVFEELKAGLRAPLSGMGTAFGSSLFGLAGALILGFLDLQAGQAQDRFFNELEEWMSTITRHTASGIVSDGDQSIPAYIQALLEQTAESLEDLQRIVGRAEEGRVSANRNLQALAERLTALTDQMRAEQSLLMRLAEQQLDLEPLIRRLAETAGQSGIDQATRDHIRNLDIYMARLLEELNVGRGELLQDMRNEIKLLARTITAAREEERK